MRVTEEPRRSCGWCWHYIMDWERADAGWCDATGDRIMGEIEGCGLFRPFEEGEQCSKR